MIGGVIECHRAYRAALADALTCTGSAVFLVDEDGGIAFANDKGKALVEEGKILRRTPNVLTAQNYEANRALQDALAGTKEAAGMRTSVVALTKAESERWLAFIHPIALSPRSAKATVVAVVIVRKAEFDTTAALAILQQFYSLTPMELRVLHAVAEIGSTPAIGRILGISESTVKTHLTSLFNKTGARRQVELIKLLAAYAR